MPRILWYDFLFSTHKNFKPKNSSNTMSRKKSTTNKSRGNGKGKGKGKGKRSNESGSTKKLVLDESVTKTKDTRNTPQNQQINVEDFRNSCSQDELAIFERICAKVQKTAVRNLDVPMNQVGKNEGGGGAGKAAAATNGGADAATNEDATPMPRRTEAMMKMPMPRRTEAMMKMPMPRRTKMPMPRPTKTPMPWINKKFTTNVLVDIRIIVIKKTSSG